MSFISKILTRGNNRCFTIFFFGLILAALFWFAGRELVSAIYAGTAPAFLNGLITGQSTHALGEYQQAFNKLVFTVCAVLLLPLLLCSLLPGRFRRGLLDIAKQLFSAAGHARAAIIAILSLAFLSIITGAWLAWSNAWIYSNWLEEAFNAANAIYINEIRERPLLGESDVWVHEGKREFQGLRTYVPELAYDGLTLAFGGQNAWLLDMDGTVVHKWHVDYDSLESDHELFPRTFPKTYIYWHQARLMPNGDLVILVDQYDKSPNGLAMIKIDSRSRLLWAYPHHVHHDFNFDTEGNIYALDQEIRNEDVKGLKLKLPYLDEGIVILSPGGARLDRISIINAFSESDFTELFNGRSSYRNGDYLHTNNLDIIQPGTSFFEPGGILLSFNGLSTIAMLNIETRKIVWAKAGYWHYQHDPDILANGNIMLFDNLGAWTTERSARVVEFNPETYQIVWSYPNGTEQRLFSSYRGRQQPLPNGNVLISEFESGRLLEVTRKGRIVWEYSCPFRSDIDPEYLCNIVSARRYDKDTLYFDYNGGVMQ